jgi:hypothetical protein
MSLEDPPPTGPLGDFPRVPGPEAPGTPPAAAPLPEKRGPSELDEFLARAVDRQIAEQRALRETLQELKDAVKELQARPAAAPDPGVQATLQELRGAVKELRARPAPAAAPPSPAMQEALQQLAGAVRELQSRPPAAAQAPAINPAELEARVKRAMDANTETFVNELRDLRSTVLPGLQRAIDATSGARGIEHDLSILRDAVGGLSADVEGIAQALIDLNAGLRDWANGVDQNVDSVREAVQHVRELGSRIEELQSEALEAAGERRVGSRPLLPIEGELVDAGGGGAVPVPQTAMATRDIPTEIEQRVKETIELSLYLADQIESFDKAISNLGDLPTRLEGVISQALKRTLAARAKLDRDAEMALDEVVATLDEHVESIGDLTETATTMRDIAAGQAQLASGMEAIAEAIDRSSEGRLPRARTSVAKAASRKPARKSSAKKKPPLPRANTGKKAKAKAKNTAARRKRKPPEASYLSLDADTD